MMKGLIATVLGVLLAATLAWGAWVSVEVPKKADEKEFVEHKDDDNRRFMEVLKEIQEQREVIEEKLDDIQERL